MAQTHSVIFVDNSLCHLKESQISDFVNKANLAYFGGLLTDQDTSKEATHKEVNEKDISS